MSDSLREALLDAILDGTVGKGLIISCQELIKGFSEYSELHTGCFLSSSEMDTATHSPTYDKFTCPVGERRTECIHKRWQSGLKTERRRKSENQKTRPYP